LDAEHRDDIFRFHIADVALSFLFDKSLTMAGPKNQGHGGASDSRTHIEFRVHAGQPPKTPIQSVLFDSGRTWALYRSGGTYVLQNDTLGEDSHPNTVAIIESDFQSGDLYLAPSALHKDVFSDPLGYPLNQILVILLLSRRKSLILHACGINDGGLGYVFLGYSGDGKSTLAKVWFENRATILNDDRIVIQEKDGGFWMHGTPWHGEFKAWSCQGIAVQKMFFLRRGFENAAVLKGDAQAVSMVLARSFPPFWDEAGMADILELCHRLVNNVPCYELCFTPHKGVLQFVRQL
jgi:hypothetical protein